MLKIKGLKNYTSVKTDVSGCSFSVSSANLISNCAAYAVFNGLTNDPTCCIACLPGFAPIYDERQRVTACTPIAGCDNSLALLANGCEACLTQVQDGQLVYYAFADELQQKCLPVKSPNCYIADSNQRCVVCQAGFWANPDGYCEQLSVPNCQATSIASSLNYRYIVERSTSDANS